MVPFFYDMRIENIPCDTFIVFGFVFTKRRSVSVVLLEKSEAISNNYIELIALGHFI